MGSSSSQAIRHIARTAASAAGWLGPQAVAEHSPNATPLDGAQRAAVSRGLLALADQMDDASEETLQRVLAQAHGLVRFIASLEPDKAGQVDASSGTITLASVVARARQVLDAPGSATADAPSPPSR